MWRQVCAHGGSFCSQLHLVPAAHGCANERHVVCFARTARYTYLFGSYLVASSVGPALAVVLFHVYGNGWSLRELRNVMLVRSFD
jgi:hypothetical protein